MDAARPDAAGRRPTLAVIGGGTGLSVLLRGLKHEVGQRLGALTAVVTVADDGGSSGRLRRTFGVLPPGDIRNCLVSLADDEDLLARLFQYRFGSGEGLSGHSFGNLFLTALTEVTGGDFYRAVLTAEKVLSVRGRIVPATLADVRLRGLGASGRTYEGESAVGRSGEPLARLSLEPADAEAFAPAVEALRDADLIVLGPGSLYTSILPNLLIPGIRDAVAARRGRCVLALNLMTQPGETTAMDAAAHIDAIHDHVGPLVDVALVHAGPLPADVLARYAQTGARPVRVDRDAIAKRGVAVAAHHLLDASDDLIRHDPAHLCRAVLDLLSWNGVKEADDDAENHRTNLIDRPGHAAGIA
ncbi:MAG: uridine diphosphate-N-acetylglucosamine-binding protein YvcK [Acidobacteriota bacterium]